jgi:hypothetical protein
MTEPVLTFRKLKNTDGPESCNFCTRPHRKAYELGSTDPSRVSRPRLCELCLGEMVAAMRHQRSLDMRRRPA